MSATVRCRHCELVQTRREDGRCRRCGKAVAAGRIETTTVVLLGAKPHAVPLKTLVEDAAVSALDHAKTIKGAADILEITTFKLIGILAKVDTARLGSIRLPVRKPRWTPEKKRNQAAWVAQRKADGRCIRCGKERDGESIRNCEACLKKTRQYRKRKKGESWTR